MDAEKIWEQIKEIYLLNADENSRYSFDEVKAIAYSENAKLLTLQAKDTSEAIYLNTRFADPLITALESLIGKPAFIECTYVSQVPKANPKFTVRRTDDDYMIDFSNNKNPKTALEMMLEDIFDLKHRVADLEKMLTTQNS